MMAFAAPATASHWAAALIGKPWAELADGPDAFDCRGLVRHVWREQGGRDVPALAGAIAHDATAIIDAAVEHGWRCVGRGARWGALEARELDIVMMSSPRGPHVGVMVQADRGLQLLHCVGGLDVRGQATGSVVCDALATAALRGFGKFEFWRLEALTVRDAVNRVCGNGVPA